MMAAAQEQGLKLLVPRSGVSIYAIRVQMALAIKGLPYDYLPEDPGCKSDLLLASNPVHKTLPVLIHGGRPVRESLIIMEYLDDAFPGNGASILPADPYRRAVARFWAAYVDDKLFPAWLAILRAATEEERAQKLAATLPVLAPMEEAFSSCSAFSSSGGDSIGYFDLALGCQLFWLDALREMFDVMVIDEGRPPRFAAWAERFLETEAAKTVKAPMSSML